MTTNHPTPATATATALATETGTGTGVDATRTRLLADLRRGLARSQPSIPPKWFYDDRGSALFEDITRLPEYYPTEAERTLLLDHASAIVGDADTLIELGAGISDKTTALLDALIANAGPGDRAGTPPTGSPGSTEPTEPAGTRHHVAFDISAEAIREGARRLRERYPSTAIDTEGVVGDLDLDLAPSLDRLPRRGPRLIAFLGGTLGNYLPDPRLDLLRSLSRSLDGTDRLLIGMDLVKDPAVLVRAYDDGAGVTAEFNRNVIRVLARELGADLDPAWFDHRAVWNADDRWIEMHLVANRRIDVELAPDLTLALDPGDHLLTEVSAKFTIEGARDELARAGLVADGLWTDGRYLLGRWRRAD